MGKEVLTLSKSQGKLLKNLYAQYKKAKSTPEKEAKIHGIICFLESAHVENSDPGSFFKYQTPYGLIRSIYSDLYMKNQSVNYRLDAIENIFGKFEGIVPQILLDSEKDTEWDHGIREIVSLVKKIQPNNASVITKLKELNNNCNSRSWLSSLTMIGSVIEDVLYNIAKDNLGLWGRHCNNSRGTLKETTLAQYLTAAITLEYVERSFYDRSTHTVMLIKEYRNLIHPASLNALNYYPSASDVRLSMETLRIMLEQIKRKVEMGANIVS